MTNMYEWQIRNLLAHLKNEPSESLESETIEFKGYANAKSIYNSKELAEELSAFANHNGGLVLIGVLDSSDVPHGKWDQQLRGINGVDLCELRERLGGKLKPSVALKITQVSFEGREYIAVQTEASHDTLVSTASGKTCIREGRSSRPMQPDEIEKAVKSLLRYDWSSDIPSGADFSLLDTRSLAEAVEDFRDKRNLDTPPTTDGYLEAVGATTNGKLTRGGLLFLGRSDAIHNALGMFEFRFSWKKPNGDLVINDVWSGNLWSAIKKADAYFHQCNSTEHYKYRETVFSAPLMDKIAFHEALLNAVVHRDYSVDGMTSVTYTGATLKIHSPGSFFGGVTADNIAKHEPRHRNKNLAKILMTHNLVDRAGMGVLRMGLGSLRYGRSFPEFREQSDAVEVKLEAKSIRPGVAALGIENLEDWGIPELLILNSVYESGFVQFTELESRLQNLVDSPLQEISQAVDQMPQVEICGTKDGIFVRVLPSWKSYLSVGRIFRASPTSDKYVSLFRYLRTHGEASNADLSDLFGHNHSSQTSKFLRDTSFVERHGHGPSARWNLVKALASSDPRSVV